jgi:protein tyrosine phosphatase (PTP) superfamily phosphohydrolase (DUF442 family)
MIRIERLWLLAGSVLLGVAFVGAVAAQEPAALPRKVDSKRGLENLLQVSGRIYSGGEPHGEAAFEAIAAMGVKTVISVDGARPDIEAARKHGLRYVHIPIGYDGVEDSAGRSLTRAARELKGPIYVHCHHGKHRGPAAAAVLCRADDGRGSDEALRILELAGTGKEYAGLWRDVAAYRLPAENAELPVLVEVAQVDSLTAAMAKIDRSFDNLKLCAAAGWKTPPDHPDIAPAQESTILRESLRESIRHLDPAAEEQMRTWLRQAEVQSGALERALLALQTDAAGAALKQLEMSCKQCHARYRQ